MINVTNSVRYRRAFGMGLTISVVAHVTVLVMVRLPEIASKESDTPQSEQLVGDFEAIEVIKLVEVTSPMAAASRPAASTIGAVVDIPAAAEEGANLETLFAGIKPATLALNRSTEGQPVVTHKDLHLISENKDLMSALYGDLLRHAIDTTPTSSGGLGGILSSIGSALSGGGHCPVPAVNQSR